MGIFNAGAGVGKLISALSDRDNQEKRNYWKRVEDEGEWLAFHITNNTELGLYSYGVTMMNGKVVWEPPEHIPRGQSGSFTVGTLNYRSGPRGYATFRVKNESGSRIQEFDLSFDYDLGRVWDKATPDWYEFGNDYEGRLANMEHYVAYIQPLDKWCFSIRLEEQYNPENADAPEGQPWPRSRAEREDDEAEAKRRADREADERAYEEREAAAPVGED